MFTRKVTKKICNFYQKEKSKIKHKNRQIKKLWLENSKTKFIKTKGSKKWNKI